MKKISFTAKIWKWNGPAAWFFAYVPEKESKKLRESRQKSPGFGSIRVRVTIGKTTWDTSVFPSKEGPYLLPIKASVRRAEGIGDGDSMKITCALK